MKRIYALIIFSFSTFMLLAQDFYVKQYDVAVDPGIVYATNITVLQSPPAPEMLSMDVYTPVGDDNPARPLILVAHTGSFLPPLFNGQVTGAVTDSTVVYMCKELASRGYVAAAFTYRKGWLPTAPDLNVRTSTLLNAAYRGIQDGRSCVRWFRKNALDEGNTYNIDPEKIGVAGIGTGGYISYGMGCLYEFDEIAGLDKFINTETFEPYVDTLLMGNTFGDTQAQICLPNHPGYDSEIDFAFNIGGALGDLTWMDAGDEREPAYSGVHATSDIFAPFASGPVIVPTTNEFVVAVAGTRAAVAQANENGANDVLNTIQDDPLGAEIEAQKEKEVTLLTMETINLGTDHFYAFETPFPQGSPWDWWDKPTLDLIVAGANQVFMTDFNSDTLHLSGLATNPDMSPEKGRAHMDTIMTLMLSRGCLALDLYCEGITDTEEILDESFVTMSPNPAQNDILITTGDKMIKHIKVLNLSGQLLFNERNIDDNSFVLERAGLGNGLFIAQIYFEDGFVNKKFVLE